MVALGLVIGSEAHAQETPFQRTLACMDQAAHRTDLLEVQQRRLCWGAPDAEAPVACYVEASRTLLFSDPQSIALCRCTDSLAPIACVERLRHEVRLTDPELVAACAPAIVRGLRADCTPR
jgi:hypothetical protein